MADDLNNPRGSASDASTTATDMSQYIRTYAKDVAALSGKGNIGAIPTPKPTKRATPEPVTPQKEVSDGVEFDATEQPFFERTEPKAKEMNYGPIDLGSKADADSIIQQRPSAVPMPATMQAAPTPSAPTENKEDILARLRAKVGTYTPPQPAPVAEMPAEAPTPEPAPYVPPAPIAPPASEPIAPPVFAAPVEPPVNALPPLYREPIAPEDVRTPVAEPVAMPATPRPQPVMPAASTPADDRFHSYATDFGSQVQNKAATPFAVIAAEQDRATPRPQAAATRKAPVLAIIAGTLLLVVAAGGSYAAYLYIAARQVVPTISTKVPSLVFADQTKKLTGTGTELMQALAVTATEPLVSGDVLVTYITQEPTGETGVIAGAPAPGGALIKALNLSAPDILLRNISEASTVGVTHQGSETRPFFILRVSSYERTFAGMLTWEPLMARDLALLYPLYPVDAPIEVPVPLTTASSTTATSAPKNIASTTIAPSTPVQAASRIRFEDTIVANRDVRVLRDTTGRSLLLYGYADKETLIIARDEAAFTALITRLQSSSQ